MNNVMSLPTCIIIPLHTKVVDSTSTSSHCSRSSGYDRCHLPFIDVEAEEYIEHVSDKEEGMEDNKGSYGASMHGSTLTTLNVLITLWALICVSDSRGWTLHTMYKLT
jgi:hypothetical protein